MPVHPLIPARRLGGVAGRLAVTAALVASLTVLAPRVASAHRSPAPFVDDGSFTLLFDLAPADLDPASNESEYADTVIRNVDETLIRLNGASMSQFENELATSWSANADKSVYTVHLRHGVRFHTGRCCLTADDVKYSYVRSVAANLAGSYMLGRFFSDPAKQIKVLDPYTVEFDLGRSQPMFPDAMAQDYNALVLDSKAVQAHKTKKDPWAHNWVTEHDAGTGPYMIQSWVHGQQMTLVRFPQYWDGWSGHHFSKIILRTIPDSTTRRELMERGQGTLTFDLTPQDYDALKKESTVKVVAPYATQVNYITMTDGGLLKSPYARQALSYAFPYDAYIKGILKGYARRAYGPIPSTLLGYDPHMFHYETDLNKAKELLQKAGIKPGTTFTFTYIDPYGPAGELLQAQLRQIGYDLKLTHLDDATFNNIFYGTEPISQRPNLMTYSWWPDYNDPYDQANTLIATSQQAPNGNNGGMYSNKEVDALLAQMKYAEGEKLISASYKLQDITGRVDPPAIWISEPAEVTVLAHNLQGYIPNPVELRTFYIYAMYLS